MADHLWLLRLLERLVRSRERSRTEEAYEYFPESALYNELVGELYRGEIDLTLQQFGEAVDQLADLGILQLIRDPELPDVRLLRLGLGVGRFSGGSILESESKELAFQRVEEILRESSSDGGNRGGERDPPREPPADGPNDGEDDGGRGLAEVMAHPILFSLDQADFIRLFRNYGQS